MHYPTGTPVSADRPKNAYQDKQLSSQGYTAPPPRPRLLDQIDQLNQALSGCSEIASQIEMAADRLLGPVPTDGIKGGPVPPPCETFEYKLADAIGFAEILMSRLQKSAMRLNTAV